MITFKKISRGGSITIPAALRRNKGVQSGDGMEVKEVENGFLLVPAINHCLICENAENIIMVEGKPLCKGCIEKAVKKMEGAE